MDSILIYGTDISCDNSCAHRQFICTQCYMRIYNWLKCGTQGVNEHEMKLDGAYADLKIWAEDKNIWCEHGKPSVVCDLYSEQPTPFYSPKTVRGPPKRHFLIPQKTVAISSATCLNFRTVLTLDQSKLYTRKIKMLFYVLHAKRSSAAQPSIYSFV